MKLNISELNLLGTESVLHPILFYSFGRVGCDLSPLGTSAPVVPVPDEDEDGALGGMRIGRINRAICRKSAPMSFYPPQIPHNITWDRTLSAAVGSRRLPA